MDPGSQDSGRARPSGRALRTVHDRDAHRKSEQGPVQFTSQSVDPTGKPACHDPIPPIAVFDDLSEVALPRRNLTRARLSDGSRIRMVDFDHRTSRVVDQVMGAFFLMRRRVLDELGGWDERFFVYLEDVDLAYRARLHGWLSYFFAEVRAFHRGGGVSRQVKAARLFYSLRSRILYAFKHFHPAVAILVLAGTLFLEPVTRLVYAALGNSPTTGGETMKAYWLLLRDLPFVLSLAWTLRHHADTSARALRPAGR